MRFNSGSCFFLCFFFSFSNQHEALKLEKKSIRRSIYINVEIYTIYKKNLFSKGEIDAEWFLVILFFFLLLERCDASVFILKRVWRESIVIRHVVTVRKPLQDKKDQSPARRLAPNTDICTFYATNANSNHYFEIVYVKVIFLHVDCCYFVFR